VAQPRRDHRGAAADRAVEQVAAGRADLVAQLLLAVDGMVLISMWTVPGRRPASVPRGPAITSGTASASWTIDTITLAPAATSAGLAATIPPAAASSAEPERR